MALLHLQEQDDDARGVPIPLDTAMHLGATFWSSHQFFIKGAYPKHILKQISTIPSHCFCLIRSLCFDLDWVDPSGFLRPGYCGCRKRQPSYCVYCRLSIARFIEDLDQLIEHVLSHGNEGLVVKLLWSTTMSIPLEQRCTWREDEKRYMHENIECHSAGFRRFITEFKSLGYDQQRIRVITRVAWKDEMPQSYGKGMKVSDDWDGQLFDWDEHVKEVFRIDPVSKAFVAWDLWKGVCLSNGLMWDPIQGHFNPPLDLPCQLAGQPRNPKFSLEAMDTAGERHNCAIQSPLWLTPEQIAHLESTVQAIKLQHSMWGSTA
jgi:hypothetical protein